MIANGPASLFFYSLGKIRLEEMNESDQKLQLSLRMMPDAIEGARIAIEGTNDALANTTAAASAGESALFTYNAALANVALLNNEITTAQQGLADAQAAWQSSAGGQVAGLLEAQGLKGQELITALGGVDQVMGTSLSTQEDYNQNLEAAVKEFGKSGDLDNFKTALSGIKDEFMPLDDKVKNATASLDELTKRLDALNGRVIDVLINIQSTNGVTLPLGAGAAVQSYIPTSGGGTTASPSSGKPFIQGGPLSGQSTTNNIYISNNVDAARVAAQIQGRR
jgi:hypothetical protein